MPAAYGGNNTVSSERVPATATRQSEGYGDLERLPASEGASGEIETLEGGSISIPIPEEELVITKRLVVRASGSSCESSSSSRTKRTRPDSAT